MFSQAFPQELHADVMAVMKVLPNKTYESVRFSCTEERIDYHLNGQRVIFPYRLYLKEPNRLAIAFLNDTQKLILYCMFTRSCDGYLREKYVRKIMLWDFPQWCIPFIVQLCGEYVFEIVDCIYGYLHKRDNEDIQQFCIDNKNEIWKNYARMQSYWNLYNRRSFPEFREYIGHKLFRECLGYNRSFEKSKARYQP
jgi:hypothetical protein